MNRLQSLRGKVSGAVVLLAAVVACAPAFSQIISQSVLPQPPERITVDRNNVEVTSGAVSTSAVELSIGSEPYGLTLTRFYDSRTGWRDSFTGVMEYHMWGEYLSQYSFSVSWGNQSWSFGTGNHSGDGASLGQDGDGNWILTTHDGTVITYAGLINGTPCNGDGISPECYGFYHVTKVEYPNGLIVTPHYKIFNGTLPGNARVQSVTSNAGYQIKFYYQSNTISTDVMTRQPWLTRTSAVAINNAVEYCDPDADACSLSGNWPTMSYANSNGTHTITDSLGRSTVYTYSGPTVFRIRTPASPTDNYQYTLTAYQEQHPGQFPITLWRATSVTLGGNTWSYGYVVPSEWTLTTTATDAQSGQTVYSAANNFFQDPWASDWRGWTILSIKDPLNRTTTFGYPCNTVSSLNTQAYAATAPEGNGLTRTCDGSGNVLSVTTQPKPGSGLANVGTSATFSPSCTDYRICNKPTAIVDARGAQTDYIYDAAHGGVLTETLPAINICAPSGSPCPAVRPQKRYAYQQFSAYVKNASGSLVQAPGSVWMPTQVSECRTSAYSPSAGTCAAGASDEIVTSFEYGATGTANRLLVRGKVVTSGGVSLRTCYSYDQFGNKLSVSTPRAGFSSCPESFAAAAAFTSAFRFDAARQLVGTISAPITGGYEADLNLYAYVGNDPLDKTDPSGNCPDACVVEGGVAISAGVVYATAAGLMAIGVCVESCGAVKDWIGNTTSKVWDHIVHTESKPADTPPAPGPSSTRSKSNPLQGAPGSVTETKTRDGQPKQTREYGEDGYPDRDVDHDHDHGQGQPHVHDWTRPADGSAPTHEDRQPGRAPAPREVEDLRDKCPNKTTGC